MQRTEAQARYRAEITRAQLQAMACCLFTEQWRVRVIDANDGGCAIAATYKRTDLFKIETARFLRLWNMLGHHIYGRPDSTRHVMIDDLDADALDAMRAAGLRPNAVVVTSKGNHQAWIALSKDQLSPAVATAAAKLLARRFGGDLGSADGMHFGRLPGFTNRKEIYESNGLYPWTQMLRIRLHAIPPGAADVVAEAERVVRCAPSPSSTLGGCDPEPAEAALFTRMSEVGACELYEGAVASMVARGWKLPTDRSDLDFRVARSLLIGGLDHDDVVCVLMQASAKARERGLFYAARTMQRAAN